MAVLVQQGVEMTKHDSRVDEWVDFISSTNQSKCIFYDSVLEFIIDQTIPRYGDLPNDLAASWTADICLKQIEKYKSRAMQPPTRKQDLLWDTYKRAHYACMAYFKGANSDLCIAEYCDAKKAYQKVMEAGL